MRMAGETMQRSRRAIKDPLRIIDFRVLLLMPGMMQLRSQGLESEEWCKAVSLPPALMLLLDVD